MKGAAALNYVFRVAGAFSNRDALREATRCAHDRAEEVWTPDLMARDRLAPFLTRMFKLHEDLGLPAALRCDVDGAESLERSRISALAQDLGVSVGTRPSRADWSPSGDEAWGVLYALNGSALGATALLRSRDPETAPAYLRLMRDYARSGALGAFFKRLNAQDLDLERAGAGATRVFAAMMETDEMGGGRMTCPI